MKIIAVIICILNTAVVVGQITKTETTKWEKYGEVKNGRYLTEIKSSIQSNDTVYLLGFTNQVYQYTTDPHAIVFEGKGGILDTLYSTLSNSFGLEEGESNNFVLGDDQVSVSSGSVMGTKYIQINVLSKRAYFTLTRKQLDKLFNKKLKP